MAFKIGDDIETLKKAKAELEAANVEILRFVDHEVSKSIYMSDPDGNTVEVYIDASDSWKTDPQRVYAWRTAGNLTSRRRVTY